MQINWFGTARKATYLGQHKRNDNIRIGSVTTWVETIVLAHSQYHVLTPMTVSVRRLETILVLAHSQYHVLTPMTASVRRLETILVLASQDVVNGPTKSRPLARCANSLGPIKYRINTPFPIHTRRKLLLYMIM